MSTTKIADIVAAIPFGNEGRKRYVTVGALLKQGDNDASKGPGFVIALDQYFNPAGVPGRDSSVFLSCYHPKERAQAASGPVRQRPLSRTIPGDLDDDDIPF